MIQQLSKIMRLFVGSRNDRMIKAYRRRAEQVIARHGQFRDTTDSELRDKTAEFMERIKNGESIRAIEPEALALAREVMDRAVGIRNIFNPEHEFDPAVLPSDMQSLYAKVKQEADALEPVEVKGGEPAPGWMQVEIPPALYEAVRKVYPRSRPPFRAEPFEVQVVGAMVLAEGRIAEMKTGEGKTIVGPMACYLAALEGMQCHVVTVNDYLVQRDRDWVFPFYHWLGLTIGAIHPIHMQPPQLKKAAYECNVVYGTNSEFGFDFLRDNMKLSLQEQVQRKREFCIIDEVDSILIDEARTPLIISGPAHQDTPRYKLADDIAAHLMQKQREWDAADKKVQRCLMEIKGHEGDIRNARDKAKIAELKKKLEEQEAKLPELEAERDQYTQYYEVEREKKAAHLTHEGVAEAQKIANIGSFYVGNNVDFPHLLENALRAHVIYLRDRDYVVQNGEVVIVDPFTGRLMVGRQWSDGLHQAVEMKERVEVKEETQTLATITIQNFAKLYDRLAGMTGTAITEATEFNDIYELDVICIPTNVPVIRDDHNDLIYLSQKDKWEAVLSEIKRMHDIGRPVLVGTTSVENSEMLSDMLTKRHAIQHSVLNAKQHEREADVVAEAGALGAVMIATNMAGRGTDIKLRPVDRETLIRHWKARNLMPSGADPKMNDDDLIMLAYRHMAQHMLGMKRKDIEAMSDDEVRLELLRQWVREYGPTLMWYDMKWWQKLLLYKYFMTPPWHDPRKIAQMSAEQLIDVLDHVPDFFYHRLSIFEHIERLGGLHIVGTERHESRRIDNQLRGRAGRQGDQGSSRFFVSLEDDLMSMFAKGWVMKVLPKLGMKEGDALEHPMVTRTVEKAQRKVEEINFEQRKSLMDYDEVMEHQRGDFYGTRQRVLEGDDLQELIFDYITNAVADAAETYLDRDYVPTQIAEWCRQTLEVSLAPERLRMDELEGLDDRVRSAARDEARQTIELSLGEYMSEDIPQEEWDTRGLSSWAMSRFGVNFTQAQLNRMDPHEVADQLEQAAAEQIEKKDLSGLSKFLDPLYAEKEFVEWVDQKFDVKVDAEELKIGKGETESDRMNRVCDLVLGKARERYQKREVEYPVNFVLDMIASAISQDPKWAMGQLAAWANQRFQLGWTVEQLMEMDPGTIQKKLLDASRQWQAEGKLEAAVDEAMATHKTPEDRAKWARERFAAKLVAEQLETRDEAGQRQLLLDKGRELMRAELTQLERFVLLQVLDQTWKDHLYTMDQLKDSVGLRGYAERDPRIEYKKEGARQYGEMQSTVRDRVAELIFRARLTAQFQQRSVFEEQEAQHADAGKTLAGAATGAGTEEQQADMAAANQAGSRDSEQQLSRRQRRARGGKQEQPSVAKANRQRRRRRR